MYKTITGRLPGEKPLRWLWIPDPEPEFPNHATEVALSDAETANLGPSDADDSDDISGICIGLQLLSQRLP